MFTNQKNLKHSASGRLILSITLLGGLSFTPAFAEDEEQVKQLEEIIVTAGRTPVAEDEVGRSYTVLSGEELEKTQARYVADVLRRVPGIAVSRSGSFGGLTQIRLRGSEGNHVLVLIDGVEVAGTSSGEFDFGALQVADIERIEIIRGPQSALFGSNATSGVVQIITKGGIREGYKVTSRSELGTDKTVRKSLLLQGGGETFDIAVSGALRRTSGFNISDLGSEKDGDRNFTLNSKIRWDITENVFFDGNLRFVDRKSDTDDQNGSLVTDTNSYVESQDVFGGAGLNWELFDGQLQQQWRFEATDLHTEGKSSWGPYGNDGNRYHSSFQSTWFFDLPDFLNSTHSLTGAVEWERETYKETIPTRKLGKSRDLYGHVLEYRGDFLDRFFVTGALRYDRNEVFKNALTYSASAAYLIPQTETRLHASIGTGVTNPTFYEQFGSVPGKFRGNPDLKPETNFGWDIGIEQRFLNDRGVIDLTYFQEDLKDEITGSAQTVHNQSGTSKRRGG